MYGSDKTEHPAQKSLDITPQVQPVLRRRTAYGRNRLEQKQ
jgi:hypothetical protein